MGRKAGRHRKAGEWHADHAGFADENADVVEIATILRQAAGFKFAKARGRFPDYILPFGDDHNGVAGRQREIRSRDDVLPALTNHGDLDAFRQVLGEFIEPAAGEFVSNGNFAHVEALRFRREFWLDDARHEIDAQDRADHAEGIGDRVSDRRLLIVHDVQRRLKRGGAGHRSGIDAQRVADFDTESLTQTQRD